MTDVFSALCVILWLQFPLYGGTIALRKLRFCYLVNRSLLHGRRFLASIHRCSEHTA